MIRLMASAHDLGHGWNIALEDSPQAYSLHALAYGKCCYWVRHEKIVMEKGDVLFVPRDVPFYAKSIPTVAHEKYRVEFTAEPEEGWLPVLNEAGPVVFKPRNMDLLLRLMKKLHAQWTDRPDYYQVKCLSLLLDLLAEFNRDYDAFRRPDVKSAQTAQMKKYVQEHYREKVTKEELGRFIGKSPAYAATIFKETTGQTIGEYVHALRIEASKYLLRHSELTIGDIADHLGYCDQSYFQRTFKRITGEKPSLYMNEREKKR